MEHVIVPSWKHTKYSRRFTSSFETLLILNFPLDRAEGPKHRISIMPRTDFKTLYAMYGNDESTHTKNKKCKRKKKDPKYEKLIEIIKHLAQKKGLKDAGKIEKATFKWTKPPASLTGPPVAPPRSDMQSACKSLNLEHDTVDWTASWPTKTKDYRAGELSIETWVVFTEGKVDPLSLMYVAVSEGHERPTLTSYQGEPS